MTMVWARENKSKDNDVTRIKGKGKNKCIGKVKARSNDKTGVKVRTLQRYYKFKKKCKRKNKWKEKGKSIEMGRWEDRKKIWKIHVERAAGDRGSGRFKT